MPPNVARPSSPWDRLQAGGLPDRQPVVEVAPATDTTGIHSKDTASRRDARQTSHHRAPPSLIQSRRARLRAPPIAPCRSCRSRRSCRLPPLRAAPPRSTGARRAPFGIWDFVIWNLRARAARAAHVSRRAFTRAPCISPRAKRRASSLSHFSHFFHIFSLRSSYASILFRLGIPPPSSSCSFFISHFLSINTTPSTPTSQFPTPDSPVIFPFPFPTPES